MTNASISTNMWLPLRSDSNEVWFWVLQTPTAAINICVVTVKRSQMKHGRILLAWSIDADAIAYFLKGLVQSGRWVCRGWCWRDELKRAGVRDDEGKRLLDVRESNLINAGNGIILFRTFVNNKPLAINRAREAERFMTWTTGSRRRIVAKGSFSYVVVSVDICFCDY